MLGNIKNETTTPQVELLFRKRFMDVTSGFYWDRQGLYAPSEGSGVQPYYRGCCGTSSDSGCTVTWSSEGVMTDDCPEGQRCQYHTGVCFPPEPADFFGGDGSFNITSTGCGSLSPLLSEEAANNGVLVHSSASYNTWLTITPPTTNIGDDLNDLLNILSLMLDVLGTILGVHVPQTPSGFYIPGPLGALYSAYQLTYEHTTYMIRHMPTISVRSEECL